MQFSPCFLISSLWFQPLYCSLKLPPICSGFGGIAEERKNHNSNKAEHVNVLLQEKTNNSELIKSRLSQKHILSDRHQHLNDGPNIVIHHVNDNDQGRKESNENNIKGKDAGKINAPELMSDINTLTNPYNVKRKIDL